MVHSMQFEENKKTMSNLFIKSEMQDDALSVTELKVLYDSDGATSTNFPVKLPNSDFETYGKSVDFVLVYSVDSVSHINTVHECKEDECDESIRTTFEGNLMKEGLELEKETANGLTFVKIHAPRPVLRKFCEVLKLKMPMKQTKEEKKLLHDFNIITEVKTVFKKFIRFFVTIDPDHYKEKNILYAEYSRDKYYLFDENSSYFFTPTVRILVVDFLLHRCKWTNDENDLRSIGIQTLLDQGVYKSAYPLHDGGYRQKGNLRDQLRVEWASMNKWIRLQPLDDVKEYLGVKYAFYFAWLGFYTQLLIPPAIFGIAVFIYGFMFLSTDEYSSYVCGPEGVNTTMCPLCDKLCGYWQLSENCLSAKITYLFDNNFTVVFAFLMSVWATLFLELWKRHSAVLSHCWGLADYSPHSEHPRPQYLAVLSNVKKTKYNADTNQWEPKVSFWFYKLPTVIFSYTVVIMMILIVIAVVVSIVLFRMWLNFVYTVSGDASWLSEYSSIVIPLTVGILNLISIMILNAIYENIANFLTSLELPRTQIEFENSLSIKLYVFQFVNYYASMMYIAFFKGKFVGYPSNYNKIGGFRQEECNSGGCLIELSIQLAIIMVGQQIMNSIIEMVVPAGWRWFNQYSLRKSESEKSDSTDKGPEKQWCEDYNLLDWGKQGLFCEYLEIAMQFGFVTLFASAFPLAPLFALINNIFELRLDAQKILKYYRRPVPYQVPNIGVWYRIADVIGKMAVVFNAGIIAFSSSFIPRIIYHLESPSGVKFGDFTLSKFSVSRFTHENGPSMTVPNFTECRYYGYREPPHSEFEYQHTVVFWKILAARLLFMFIFQNTVFIIKTAAQWMIPDVPAKLAERIKSESRIITELMIKRETEVVLNKAGLDNVESRHKSGLNDS